MGQADARGGPLQCGVLYWLPPTAIPGPGGLAMLPMPGNLAMGRRLDADLAYLRAAGISLLVTLNPEQELSRLASPTFLDEVRAAGLESLHFAIPDGGAPHDLSATDSILADVQARITAGQKVGLHCLAGLGRTGTIAACVLVRGGATFNEAIRIVRMARSSRAIETSLQEAFVRSYYEWVRQHARR